MRAKTTLLAGLFGTALLALAGCADEGDEASSGGGVSSQQTPMSVCLEHCEYFSTSEGCDSQAVLGACESMCEFVAPYVPDACAELYADSLACDMDMGVAYQCDGSFTVDDVAMPIPVDTATCEDEYMAASMCFGENM